MFKLTGSPEVASSANSDLAAAASRLSALRPVELRDAADRMSSTGRAMAAAGDSGETALAQLSRGWSAPEPRSAIARLLVTASGTAGVLVAQAGAMNQAATVIEQAQSNALLDLALAEAEIRQLRQSTPGTVLSAVVGLPQVAQAQRITGIVEELTHSFRGRLAAVENAVLTLRSQLAVDPTTGPDALRAGQTAVLPPDPVMNPAVRTDQANRAALAADLRSGDPARIRFASSILESLQAAAMRSGTAQLVVYDPAAFDGQGRAAISVGNLASATKVAVLVPGIANSPAAMSGGVALSADLRDEAQRQDPDGQTAVVAWYGYDIPLSWTKDPRTDAGNDVRDTIAAGSAVSAVVGAPLLAGDLAAIRSMSQSADRTTLLGFSMGSTTVSQAADFQLPVDSIVLMGSPGAGWSTTTASGYRNVPADDVYVLSYDQDPVTLPVTDRIAGRATGMPEPFGPDPASKSFGGNHIDASSNVPVVTGTGLIASVLRAGGDPRHHSMTNYMQGQALVAEGSIVVGKKRDVRTKEGR